MEFIDKTENICAFSGVGTHGRASTKQAFSQQVISGARAVRPYGRKCTFILCVNYRMKIDYIQKALPEAGSVF